MSRERSISIVGFGGLNERRVLGSNIKETSSLDNVHVRDGVVFGRKGINEFDNITSADADTPILGTWEYYRSTSGNGTHLRMTPTKMRVWNSGTSAWDDITGTALTGTSTTRPQACTIGEIDTFAFTNEGEDRPRKYTGSGNTAELGGTPPFAKAMEFWLGFLALGNISSDGTTFSPLDLKLSDDPDGTWEDCSGVDILVSTLVMNESPGEILALKVMDRALMVYKSDAIVQVTLGGGAGRFQRIKLRLPMGIGAPLSLQSCGDRGHIMLGRDRNLYLINGLQAAPLPPNVQKSLREVMSVAKAPYVRSAVDVDNDTYNLFYQRNGTTYMDGRLIYNYRTGEFSRDVYPVEFNSASSFRQTPTAANKLIASSATLTYELDTGTDDNGTAVDRNYDIDWTNFGQAGNKWVTGAEFTFSKKRDCRVRISVAVDKSSKFLYPKTFTLQGNDPDEEDVRISYDINPLFGTWFKFRVEMLHDGSTHVVEMKEFAPNVIGVHGSSEDTANSPQALSS